jgi:hypothetical protein
MATYAEIQKFVQRRRRFRSAHAQQLAQFHQDQPAAGTEAKAYTLDPFALRRSSRLARSSSSTISRRSARRRLAS